LWLKKYNILARKRNALFNKFITEGFPPVREQWYYRHPNSVILDRMPGVITAPGARLLRTPHYGIGFHTQLAWLVGMSAMGYISFKAPRAMNRTYVEFVKNGITRPCNLPFIPLTPAGVHVDILAMQPRGIIEYYKRTGRSVLSLNGETEYFEPSKYWLYFPTFPLTLVRRMIKMMNQRGIDKHPRACETFHKLWNDAGNPHLEDDRDEEATEFSSPQSDEPTAEEINSIKRIMQSLLDSAGTSVSIKAKIVFDGKLIDPTRLPAGFESEFTEPIISIDDYLARDEAPDWCLPDEGYDIWESLGDFT